MQEYKKDQIDYYEIKKLFLNCNMFSVYKKFHLGSALIGLFSIFIFILLSTFILKNSPLIFFSYILCFIILLGLLCVVKELRKKFIEEFPQHKEIIEEEKEFWIGCQFALFEEHTRAFKIDKNALLEKLNAELEYKQFNILKDPLMAVFFTSIISFVVLFTNLYISLNQLSWEQTFPIIFFIALLHVFPWFTYSFVFPFFQTQEKKLKTLKFFIQNI